MRNNEIDLEFTKVKVYFNVPQITEVANRFLNQEVLITVCVDEMREMS